MSDETCFSSNVSHTILKKVGYEDYIYRLKEIRGWVRRLHILKKIRGWVRRLHIYTEGDKRLGTKITYIH